MSDYAPTSPDVLFEAAIRYHRAGLVVLPNDPVRKHAIGFKWQDLSPTEDDIRIGLEGNLCRCTGYHNIVKAVLAAAGK